MDLKIKPRTAGLWMCPARGGKPSDAGLVDKAQEHLLQLLEDPYYFEAFQRIRTAKYIPNVKLPAKGKLAGKWQRPEPTKRPTGRPSITDRTWADNILDTLDRLNIPLAIRLCRNMAKGLYPRAMPHRQEKLAQDFLQMLKNHKKKRDKTTV